jgi:hypothetical protein
MIGATPSRIKSLRELRRRMDDELAKAIEPEEARRLGLSPVTAAMGVRLWDNVILAIRIKKEAQPERDPRLVRLREGRYVQVWARKARDEDEELSVKSSVNSQR